MILGLTSPGYDRVLGDAQLNPALKGRLTGALGGKTIAALGEAAKAAAGAAPSGKSEKLQQLEGVAKSFESIFMNMVMTSMRQTVQKSPYFDGGFSEQVWTQQLDQELSKLNAERGHGFGLAAQIVKKYAKHVK